MIIFGCRQGRGEAFLSILLGYKGEDVPTQREHMREDLYSRDSAWNWSSLGYIFWRLLDTPMLQFLVALETRIVLFSSCLTCLELAVKIDLHVHSSYMYRAW